MNDLTNNLATQITSALNAMNDSSLINKIDSVFLKFWNFTGKGNLKSLAPLLYSNLTVWETGYIEAHAEPFTRYYNLRFLIFNLLMIIPINYYREELNRFHNDYCSRRYCWCNSSFSKF